MVAWSPQPSQVKVKKQRLTYRFKVPKCTHHCHEDHFHEKFTFEKRF